MKTNKLGDFWVGFLFCLFIYPPMIKGATLLSYMIIYGLPTAYIILNITRVKKIPLKQFAIIGICVLLLLFSILYPTIHGTGDFSYIKISTYVFRKLIIFVFLDIVLAKQYKSKLRVEHFMYYYALTHAIYVIGTILLVTFPALNRAWFSVFAEVTESSELLQSYGYTFRIGWQGFSGFRLTIHCTLSCIFILYLYFIARQRINANNRKLILIYLLCFLGNMFYGRSGLVLTLVSSVIGLFAWRKEARKKIIQIGFALGVGVVILLIIKDISFFQTWYLWMSTPIKNLLTTGSFNNVSFNTTFYDMIFIPDIKTIIFGDGRFVDGNKYYMHTDSGLMRNILFWGILGALTSYGATVYSIVDLKKNSRFLMILVILCFVVFELKGAVYYEFIALMCGMSFIDVVRRDDSSINIIY